MTNIPSVATKAEIDFFTEGLVVPLETVNTRYAAMAYLGMCRHRYETPDWLICQFAWDESIDDIQKDSTTNADQIKLRIEECYRRKGYIPKE